MSGLLGYYVRSPEAYTADFRLLRAANPWYFPASFPMLLDYV